MLTLIIIGLLGVIALGMSLILIRFTILLHRFTFTPVESNMYTLPSVSVCIPARNETHAMTECLERVLASDYEKLEIIVLDDSSVDDTSVLIKSFAHAGVRFVEGSVLPNGWLGKNHALAGLLKEASSKYILFLDVDTIVQPYSIRQLVSWAVTHNQKFTSIIPQRADGLRASVFLGTLRYFWLLLFHRRHAPAASSAAWLIDRATLIEAGGFESIKNNPQPEMHLAHAFSSVGAQQLVVSNPTLGVTYEKKWSSQVEASVRLLKPTFGGVVPSLVAASMLMSIALLPIALLIIFAFTRNSIGIHLAVIDILLTTLLSLRYFKAIWRYGWWLGALHWPMVVVQEAILTLLSVGSYARGSVTWKGRPVVNHHLTK